MYTLALENYTLYLERKGPATVQEELVGLSSRRRVVFRFRFTVRGADTSSAKDATPNLSRRSVPLAAREFN